MLYREYCGMDGLSSHAMPIHNNKRSISMPFLRNLSIGVKLLVLPTLFVLALLILSLIHI